MLDDNEKLLISSLVKVKTGAWIPPRIVAATWRLPGGVREAAWAWNCMENCTCCLKVTEYCAWRDYCLQIAACLKARWTLIFIRAGIYGFVILITKWIWFYYYNKIVCWMIMRSWKVFLLRLKAEIDIADQYKAVYD